MAHSLSVYREAWQDGAIEGVLRDDASPQKLHQVHIPQHTIAPPPFPRDFWRSLQRGTMGPEEGVQQDRSSFS